MNKRKTIALFLALILLSGVAGGCGDSATFFEFQNAYTDVTGMTLWGESAQMSYEVPKSVPNIEVNQTGYQAGSRKTAIFRGAAPGTDFRVVDAQSGACVYEAKLTEKEEEPGSGEAVSYGTFTDFDRAGSYYVEADEIGRSYTFSIGNDIYADIFDRTYRSLLSEQESWTIRQRCHVLATLLTSYSLYPEMYAGDGDNNRIPDVLDFSGEQIALLMKNGQQATPQMAMVMAQFSRAYSVYDRSFSNECLRNAEAAYDIFMKNREQYDGEELYCVASQLYCDTGAQKYRKVIQNYLGASPKAEGSGMRLYADVAYLSTKYKVDLELCTELMEQHMQKAEQIAQESHEQLYMTCLEPEQDSVDTLLDSMVELAFVDYVITNHEYANVMENHLHYFLGRNPYALSFITDFGTAFCEPRQDVLAEPEKHAEFVFMMSAVMKHTVKTEQ